MQGGQVTKRKSKRPTKKALFEKADIIFGKYIRMRDKYCIISGSSHCLQCSHYYGKRAHPATRYHEQNAHAMNAGVHMAHHTSDPEMYRDWMHDKYGDDYMAQLRLDANMVHKYTEEELHEIIEKYAEKVRRLESSNYDS
jgi:hypothetical protein